MTTEIKLSLPDKLASEAQQATAHVAGDRAAYCGEAVRRKAVDELFEKMDELADVNFPPMTMEEIQAEVDAVRAKDANAPRP